MVAVVIQDDGRQVARLDPLGHRAKGEPGQCRGVGSLDAVVPSIAGWARLTGHNTVFIDSRDPYAHGFQVA